jgi:hypothetical protein
MKIGPKYLVKDILYYVEKRSIKLAKFNLISQQIDGLNEKISAKFINKSI